MIILLCLQHSFLSVNTTETKTWSQVSERKLNMSQNEERLHVLVTSATGLCFMYNSVVGFSQVHVLRCTANAEPLMAS